MKLRLITEVFNKPSLDGIETEQNGDTFTYSFSSEIRGDEVTYNVFIIRNKSVYDLERDLGVEVSSRTIPNIEKYGNQVEIILEGDDDYSKTGFGNQFEVYSKLIASIHHYVNEYVPIALKFSGYEPDMDLVYNRMIKMANKTWPEHAYVPISEKNYVRKEVHEALMQNIDYKEHVEAALKEREKLLRTNKEHKKEELIKKRELIKQADNNLKVREKLRATDDAVKDTAGEVYYLHRYGTREVTLSQDHDGKRKLFGINVDEFTDAVLNGRPLDHSKIENYDSPLLDFD